MSNKAGKPDFLLTQSRDTATRIKAAAVYLFSLHGYAGTSIRDIARASGVTNAGIYHFVETKEALLIDIMRQGQKLLTDVTDQSMEGLSRPEDKLGMLISGLAGAHGRNRMLSRVTDGELRALTPGTTAYDEIVAERDSYEIQWSDTLRAGVQSGIFTIGDQSVTRLALMAMCTGVSEWYRPDGAQDIASITEIFVTIGLASVGANRNGMPLTSADVRMTDPALLPLAPWEPSIQPIRAEKDESA